MTSFFPPPYTSQPYCPGTLEYDLTAEFIRKTTTTSNVITPGLFQPPCEEPVEVDSPVVRNVPLPAPAVLRRQSLYNLARQKAQNSFSGKGILPQDQPKKVNADKDYHYHRPHIGPESPDPRAFLAVFDDEACPAHEKQDPELEQRRLNRQLRTIPPGSVLFLLGFLFMPFWWMGAFSQRNGNRIDLLWRTVNRWMSAVSLVALVALWAIFIAIQKSSHSIFS